MQKTGIEYLDYTWNPIAMRCTPCSPGCEHCWHLRMANRLCKNPTIPEDERKALAGGVWWFVLREREIEAPLRLKKPSVIGVQFMGDLYHERVSDYFIAAVYGIASLCPQHTFIFLTKREQRLAAWHSKSTGYGHWVVNEACERLSERVAPGIRLRTKHEWPLPNVYHGLTVCNQQEADSKIPEFLKVPGKKFLSLEPMLGPIDLIRSGLRPEWKAPEGNPPFKPLGMNIDLVILGGETGHGSRPLHPDWVRSVRDQCIAAGTAYFFKQWGEWVSFLQTDSNFSPTRTNRTWLREDGTQNEHDQNDGISTPVYRVGSKRAGRLLDGREWNELPWRAQG